MAVASRCVAGTDGQTTEDDANDASPSPMGRRRVDQPPNRQTTDKGV